jgi:CO dehydrogenase/acetyl-CoA synthase epsilon subunit
LELRAFDRVVIDVDDVVEHAHRRADRPLQLLVVDAQTRAAVLQVLRQIDRAQIADGDFAVVGVERDLGAQVAAVHHADMLLRRAHVAGILEGDPRMPGLEQHRQHLAPQLARRHLLDRV